MDVASEAKIEKIANNIKRNLVLKYNIDNYYKPAPNNLQYIIYMTTTILLPSHDPLGRCKSQDSQRTTILTIYQDFHVWRSRV